MEWFARLPEDCISEILSYTSAVDASRSSAVSKELKSVAQSDVVWERFLPLDYQEIISKAVSPLKYATKKDLYFSLSDSPILIDQGKMSFSIDKRSGKKCFMIGARELMISWKGCWDFIPNPMSRFSEVAKLRSMGWIHIQGKIKTEILSKNTMYAAYLVFLLESKEGLRSSNTVLRLTPNENSNKNGIKKERIESRETGKIAKMRGDGWLEIEMGRFYNSSEDEGEVEAWLTEINSPYDKSGLIVHGIEFRPL
ncbi:F-box protein PP2-B11-like [Salvia hispanica]|uniref:F-box protein PP2-B11-like n=1 Tax=Salvia hispanica TaxID=49212 RepID=UPI0020096A35|nr:F-box protein PP2-B11-like [Salvia hispanica]